MQKLFNGRFEHVNKAAQALGLPLYVIDTNLYSFRPFLTSNIELYCSLYSCALSIQRVLKKYYIASSLSYDDTLEFGKNNRDAFDFAEFSEVYAVPLIRTERIELVVDGAQYERSQKTENISDWDIAIKYLNVCSANISVDNCSVCSKCVRTLITLEAMGKLDKFSGVFDLSAYKKVAFIRKCIVVSRRNIDAFQHDIYEFAKKSGMKLPPKILPFIFDFPIRLFKKILTVNAMEALKGKILYRKIKN